MPRCPPASLPWVTTASTPARSREIASSTVVAVPITNMPRALIAWSAAAGRIPNVKLNAAAPDSSAAASSSPNASAASTGGSGRGKASSA